MSEPVQKARRHSFWRSDSGVSHEAGTIPPFVNSLFIEFIKLRWTALAFRTLALQAEVVGRPKSPIEGNS